MSDSVETTAGFIDVPDPVNLSEVWTDPPELTPPIISGVLRQGHKMMLSGPSKAGKTFCLMELALCVAAGKPWMGLYCKRGTVLYINLELDEKSCFNRFKKIGQQRQITDVSGVKVWNLRGYNTPFHDLANYIADMVKADNLSMVIVDPIYKLFTGSENNQEIVAEFCSNLDIIAKAGASVVYCHHHSKGAQGDKDSMDRASGSGVFARDADALLDMVQMVSTDGADIDPDGKGVTAWLISFTLREFRPKEPIKTLFDYPLHVVCEDGRLDNAAVKGSREAKRISGGQVRGSQITADYLKKIAEFEGVYQKYIDEHRTAPTKKEMAEMMGVSEKTISRYAGYAKYSILKGKIYKPDKSDSRTNELLSMLSSDEKGGA